MTDDDRDRSQSFDDDRREHRRHGVLINVRLRDEQRLRELYATDLSNGGIFVATRSELPLGQRLEVALVHPLTDATLTIECEVANVRRDEDGAVRGCGLRFTAFDETIREELSLFVEGVIELEPDEDLEIVEEPEGARPPPLPTDATDRKVRAHGLFLQGKLLVREGNLVGAAHVLARATESDPDNEQLWEALREVEARIRAEGAGRRPVTPEPEESVDVDLDGLSDDDVEEPEVEWEEPVLYLEEPAALETEDRRKATMLFDAARDCYGTGEVDDAVAYLKKSIGADATFVPAYCALATIVADEQGDLERAVFLCNKALEIDPSNAKARATLARIEPSSS